MRTTGHDDRVVHNFPRAPGAWEAFTGYAGRLATGAGVIARDAQSTDTDSGADWQPRVLRTMGYENQNTNQTLGVGDRVSVRIHDALGNGSLTYVVNADAAFAGAVVSIIPSYVHSSGQGPIAGLGADALQNWVALRGFEPWGATLDARASYRFDLPAGSLPLTWVGDHIVVILDATTGGLLASTGILEEDH